MTNTEKLLKRLGYQGGTIHQLVDGLNNLDLGEVFEMSDILEDDKFKVLYDRLFDEEDEFKLMYDEGYGDDESVNAVEDGIAYEMLKDNGGISITELKQKISRL